MEFRLATIDKIPLADESVDCVISNCVINLAPNKPAVFREIARILKPGGRVAVSDIALKGELPLAVAQSLAAYVGCIAGAIPIDVYREGYSQPALNTWRSLTAGLTSTPMPKSKTRPLAAPLPWTRQTARRYLGSLAARHQDRKSPSGPGNGSL